MIALFIKQVGNLQVGCLEKVVLLYYTLLPLIRNRSGGISHSGLRLFRINEIKIFFNKFFY